MKIKSFLKKQALMSQQYSLKIFYTMNNKTARTPEQTEKFKKDLLGALRVARMKAKYRKLKADNKE